MSATPLPEDRRPLHFVLWRAEPGGMESAVGAYVAAFGPHRTCSLFSLRPGPNELAVPVAEHTEGDTSNPRLYRKWFRYCRQHRRDRFHLLNCGPVILLIALLAGVRRPLYHIHGTRYWRGALDRPFLRLAWWLCAPFRPLIVANSAFSAETFRRTAFRARPVVVLNGLDSAALLAGRRLRVTLRHMVCAGRLAPGKNTDLAIRCFEAVAKKYHELELHIAGSGPLENALRDQALTSPHRRRIHFHGWVADMPAFYARMDLLLFPSAHESYGNVLAEALINGLPALVSDLPAFAEIHGDPGTFSLGDPADAGRFVQRFTAALDRFPALCERAFTLSPQLARRSAMEQHVAAIARLHATA